MQYYPGIGRAKRYEHAARSGGMRIPLAIAEVQGTEQSAFSVYEKRESPQRPDRWHACMQYYPGIGRAKRYEHAARSGGMRIPLAIAEVQGTEQSAFSVYKKRESPQRPDRRHACMQYHPGIGRFRSGVAHRQIAERPRKDKLRENSQSSIGMRISLSVRIPRSPLPPP